MIRIVLPTHLRRLVNVNREVEIGVTGPVTVSAILDELEAQYPVLRGTIRDYTTRQRRPFIRFFACGEDWTHEPVEAVLPDAIVSGSDPLRIVGAMAGG
jgi:hypothetical protein